MAKSRIFDSVHDTAQGLHDAGVMDRVTLRKFDALCLAPVEELSPTRIREIRRREKVSQQVFALYLNASPSSVRQWEQGEKRPSGPSLKLLNLVARKGLDALR
jgi:putative transcriptional regulator